MVPRSHVTFPSNSVVITLQLADFGCPHSLGFTDTAVHLAISFLAKNKTNLGCELNRQRCPHQLWQSIFMDLFFVAQGYFHAQTGLGWPLTSNKGNLNVTVHKDILNICVLLAC